MTVVRLGAWCDYVTEEEYRAQLTTPSSVPTDRVDEATGRFRPFTVPTDRLDEALGRFRAGASFRVREFAVLADGRRITLSHEQEGPSGFSTAARAPGHAAPDPWDQLTLEHLEGCVRSTVLPDEDTGEEHPWEWLVGRLRAHGVDSSPDQLRRVPYDVVFSDRLRARIAARAPR